MSTLPTQRPTQGVVPDLSSRCSGCAAPLAPDQLFCLSCGTRRRDARIAFRDVLASEAAPIIAGGGPPGAMPPTEHGTMAQGPAAGGYTPFIAMFACLLLALGLGVWIGRGQEAPAATAAPLTVPVAATTPTDAQASAATDEAAAEDEAAADEDAAAEETDEAAEPVADNRDEIKRLESLSPEEYQKQSQKLPKQIGTGGTPPPKDNKPAGGGSDFETFE